MKFKFNPLTGEFNLVPDSGTLKQKLNWLTGEFNLTKDAGKYKQIYNVIEGEFNLRPAVTQVIVHGVGSIQLTNAVENGLLSLKAFGGTEQRNLPSGYTQLEYVYMTAGSYIKVEDLLISSGYRVEFDFQTTTLGTTLRNYLGGRVGGVSAGGGFRLSKLAVSSSYNHNVVLYGFEAGTEYYAPEQFQPNTRYKYTYDNGVCTLESGGSVISTKTFTVTDNTSTSWGINSYGNGSYWQTDTDGIYVYSLKVWNDQDELVMNLVPAKTATEIGFYDMVTGALRTASAGTFTAGPNVVPTPTAPIDIISNNGVLKARHQSGLPIGYTLLDYIQSGGNNYIDTGIKLTNEDVIEMQYLQTADKGAIYGEYYNGTSNMSTTLYGNVTFYFYPYNAQGNAISVGNYDANVHTVVHNFVDGYIDFDGVRTTFDLPDPNTFTNTLNCPIFGRSNGSSIGYFSKTQLYYFRIRRNGTLILDLIPAKDSDNNVGMYDRVSGTLFTESGSGSFTAGNTVSDPMTVYADGVTETIGFGGTYTSVDGQGTYATPGSQYTTRIYKQFGRLPLGTYNVEIEGPFDFIFQYRDTPVDQERTISGNIGTWSKSGEYTITDEMYYGVAIRNDSGTGNITPTNFVNGNGKISIKGANGNVVAEMLLKIGDYVDEQEILSGDITRKVGVKVLNGTENVSTSNATFTIAIADKVSSKLPLVCSHFEYSTKTSSQVEDLKVISFSSTNIGFRYDACANTTAFKTWLANQYSAGTPVIVLYPLNTPTTETVEGQTLSIPEGTSAIGIIEASLDNLELEAVYEQEA